MFRTAIIGSPEFQSHALAHELQQHHEPGDEGVWFCFDADLDSCASRLSFPRSCHTLGLGLEDELNEVKEREAPTLVFGQDFFAEMDADLDKLLRQGEPKWGMIVLIQPDEEQQLRRVGGLTWRKLFKRILVDVYAADWEFLRRVLHGAGQLAHEGHEPIRATTDGRGLAALGRTAQVGVGGHAGSKNLRFVKSSINFDRRPRPEPASQSGVEFVRKDDTPQAWYTCGKQRERDVLQVAGVQAR
jgi:hypothetical protein